MADTKTLLAPGTPSWVDLGSPDIEASRRFYSDLFGWTSEVIMEPADAGYTQFFLNGKRVAGLGPLMEGAHPAWSTYVRTEDAAETARRVREAGGEVVAEPLAVMDYGSLAVFRDPTGAYFSVWQNGTHTGAEVFNEPGSFAWNELGTRDLPAARRFYTAVFDWGTKGEDDTYVEWQVSGRTVAGMMSIAGRLPDEVPAHWLVYFAVADTDATAERAVQLGGAVRRAPADFPGVGRLAVLADPQGAVFAVITGAS